jgi:SAM-dependent methyltransferase
VTDGTARHAPPWQESHYWPADATSILDIGCNVGVGLERAHELGIHNLFGIDINRRAIEAARSRLSRLPGVDISQIVHGSADALPFPDGSVDLARAIETLEHVPAELRPAVIREVWILRPGAPFLITVRRRALLVAGSLERPAALSRLFKRVSSLVGGRGTRRGVGTKSTAWSGTTISALRAAGTQPTGIRVDQLWRGVWWRDLPVCCFCCRLRNCDPDRENAAPARGVGSLTRAVGISLERARRAQALTSEWAPFSARPPWKKRAGIFRHPREIRSRAGAKRLPQVAHLNPRRRRDGELSGGRPRPPSFRSAALTRRRIAGRALCAVASVLPPMFWR